MGRRGGRIGPRQTVSTSSASGFWDLTTHQQERGAINWTGVITPNVEYLIVGGGGSGAKGTPAVCYGGGGGGGGFRSGTASISSGTSYTITVGGGGAGSSSISTTSDGSSSSAFSLTSSGGQGGRGK